MWIDQETEGDMVLRLLCQGAISNLRPEKPTKIRPGRSRRRLQENIRTNDGLENLIQ